jgi:hypothetical protein
MIAAAPLQSVGTDAAAPHFKGFCKPPNSISASAPDTLFNLFSKCFPSPAVENFISTALPVSKSLIYSVLH